MNWIKEEPAVFAGMVLAVIVAALNLLIAFGTHLTGDQVATINGFATVVLALVLSVYTRGHVTPVGK